MAFAGTGSGILNNTEKNSSKKRKQPTEEDSALRDRAMAQGGLGFPASSLAQMAMRERSSESNIAPSGGAMGQSQRRTGRYKTTPPGRPSPIFPGS